MLIAITKGSHTQFAVRCPLSAVNQRGTRHCAHPSIDLGRKLLACFYENTPEVLQEPSSRCPLKQFPVDDVTIEAM